MYGATIKNIKVGIWESGYGETSGASRWCCCEGCDCQEVLRLLKCYSCWCATSVEVLHPLKCYFCKVLRVLKCYICWSATSVEVLRLFKCYVCWNATSIDALHLL